MIHFSCDRCRRKIDADDLRFTISIEIQVALDSDPFARDESVEDLNVLEEILSQFDDQEKEEIQEFAYQRKQYDVCSDCHSEYVKNPLAVEPFSRVGFSEN
jgi:hypothetical protein